MKKDIVKLIEADIINTKLVSTFRSIGINADDYLTDCSTVIFRMLKIPKHLQTEELYKDYYKYLARGEKIDIPNDRNAIRTLAKEIHCLLKNHKL